jgi:hypothetical protein
MLRRIVPKFELVTPGSSASKTRSTTFWVIEQLPQLLKFVYLRYCLLLLCDVAWKMLFVRVLLIGTLESPSNNLMLWILTSCAEDVQNTGVRRKSPLALFVFLPHVFGNPPVLIHASRQKNAPCICTNALAETYKYLYIYGSINPFIISISHSNMSTIIDGSNDSLVVMCRSNIGVCMICE